MQAVLEAVLATFLKGNKRKQSAVVTSPNLLSFMAPKQSVEMTDYIEKNKDNMSRTNFKLPPNL